MELKTQALDRLFGLLSPALSEEIDRVVEETTERLEQQYQHRLQHAVSEAESAALARAASAQEQAVEEARDTGRRQATEELEQQFQQRLAEANDRVKAEAAAERNKLQTQLDQWRVFAEAQQQLAEASSQPEMLSRFLKLAEPFTGGLAVYVAKPDGLALWKSWGRAAFPSIISKETTDPESYFRTVTVRGKAVAAVCAALPFRREVLEFLTASLERAVEGFGLKLRSPLPKPVVSEKTVAVAAAAAANAAGDANTEDQRAHSEARRTARLLVSEIKLYHEQELENGRHHRDIYERLRKEIDLGRETYMHRVPGAVLAAHDYFHEELVRILGENDPSRLGPAYPGPIHK